MAPNLEEKHRVIIFLNFYRYYSNFFCIMYDVRCKIHYAILFFFQRNVSFSLTNLSLFLMFGLIGKSCFVFDRDILNKI